MVTAQQAYLHSTVQPEKGTTTGRIMAICLAVLFVFGMMAIAPADALARVEKMSYDGDKMSFFKEDLASEMGMLSNDGGDKVIVYDDGTITMEYTPSNKTGIYQYFWMDADITDGATWVNRVEIEPVGSSEWDKIKIAVDASYAGYAVPVAPISSRSGNPTSSQYYLTVPTLNKLGYYTVTFTDGQGSTLKTQVVKSGEEATAPTVPTRDGWTFAGWDESFNNVKADITVNAQWKENFYTVTFTDGVGERLDTQSVKEGAAATAPADPTRTGYTFAGWDKSFANIKADTQVNATWEKQEFVVKFVDGQGTTLTEQKVKFEEAATAPASNPTREGYTFEGWDKDFSSITADLTVTATWKVRTYEVTFYDNTGTKEGDYGKQLKEQTVEHGKAATAPADPTREGYVFAGWNPETFDSITRDTIVLARWRDPDKTYYTVSFTDGNGYTYDTQDVEEGKNATAPADPAREGYTFDGWDADFTKVAKNLTVNAKWKVITYKVVFTDGHGKTLKTEDVEHGKSATAPADPERAGHTFTGWDNAFSNITADTTVNATWAVNSYKVEFTDGLGNTIDTQTVEYGASAKEPAAPEREGYTFEKWDAAFDSISADTTVNAVWKVDTFTVTFTDGQGTTLKTETVDYGTDATPPADPERDGYTFSGWSGSYTDVRADVTVDAQWTKNEPTPAEDTRVEDVRALISKLPTDPTKVVGTSSAIQAAGKAYNALPADLQGQLTDDERMWLVKVLIAALESDPYAVTGDADGSIAMAETAYNSLPQNLRSVLDGDYDPPQPDNPETNPASLIRSSRTYGRYLENNVWAINALASIDDSTTLADGTYSGASKVASTSNMGKSRSPRNKKFLIYQVVVKNGRATAIVEHDSDASATLHIGGKEYKNLNTGDGTFPNGHSYYQIPVDLNTTFYFSVKGKEATSDTDAITYEMRVSVNEASAVPDSPASDDKKDDNASEGDDSSDDEKKSSEGNSSKDGSQSSGDGKGSGGGSGGSGGGSGNGGSGGSGSGSGGSGSGGSGGGSGSDGSNAASNGNGSGSGSPSGSAARPTGGSSGTSGSSAVSSGGTATPSMGLAARSASQGSAGTTASGSTSASGSSAASSSSSSSSSKASSSASSKNSKAYSSASSAASSKKKDGAVAAAGSSSSKARGSSAAGGKDVGASTDDAADMQLAVPAENPFDLVPIILGAILLSAALGALAFSGRFVQRERRDGAKAATVQGAWGA